jgi:hypothetical protein
LVGGKQTFQRDLPQFWWAKTGQYSRVWVDNSSHWPQSVLVDIIVAIGDLAARCEIDNNGNTTLKGTIRGKTIELETAPGLPEGQAVSVTLFPEPSPNGNLQRSFGAWAEDGQGLDAFLEQIRKERKDPRRPAI